MFKLDDGWQTLVQFTYTTGTINDVDLTGSLSGSLLFWEKRVKPPGIVGGGPVDTTTMRNNVWRTQNSKWLITLSEMTMTCAYDPQNYDLGVDGILDAVQIPGIVDILWPDESWLSFYGFIDEFNPAEMREGEQPEAEITVCPTNQNALGFEQGPVYSEGLVPSDL